MNAGAWSRFSAVFVKEFLQLKRDRLTFATMIFIPVVQLLLFGYAINNDPKHLPTTLLVQDDSSFSRALQSALEQVQTLSGLLPICAECHNIRDDQGYWSRVETFISRRSGAQFSHGLCPSCATRLYPEFYLDQDAPPPPTA